MRRKEGLKKSEGPKAQSKTQIDKSIFGHKSFSKESSSPTRELTLRQQFLKEKIHKVYTYLCEHIVPDQWGSPVCLYDLDFPGDCRADNCPFLRGVLP